MEFSVTIAEEQQERLLALPAGFKLGHLVGQEAGGWTGQTCGLSSVHVEVRMKEERTNKEYTRWEGGKGSLPLIL